MFSSISVLAIKVQDLCLHTRNKEIIWILFQWRPQQKLPLAAVTNRTRPMYKLWIEVFQKLFTKYCQEFTNIFSFSPVLSVTCAAQPQTLLNWIFELYNAVL